MQFCATCGKVKPGLSSEKIHVLNLRAFRILVAVAMIGVACSILTVLASSLTDANKMNLLINVLCHALVPLLALCVLHLHVGAYRCATCGTWVRLTCLTTV